MGVEEAEPVNKREILLLYDRHTSPIIFALSTSDSPGSKSSSKLAIKAGRFLKEFDLS